MHATEGDYQSGIFSTYSLDHFSERLGFLTKHFFLNECSFQEVVRIMKTVYIPITMNVKKSLK